MPQHEGNRLFIGRNWTLLLKFFPLFVKFLNIEVWNCLIGGAKEETQKENIETMNLAELKS